MTSMLRRITALCGWVAGPAVGLLLQPAALAFGDPRVRVWLPEGVTTTTPALDRLFYAILILTGAVFILVQVALIAFLIRYRRHPERRAAYIHGNTMVEIVWTAIPAVIMVALALYSQRVWALVRGTPPAPDMEIEVTGEQFAWNVRYAGADGKLNTADDIATINQLHLPVDKTALIHITSKDVIHSFFVPQFRMKQDAVPGLKSRIWVKPVKSGDYEIACAELCGLGHYRMRGFLVVEPDEAFQAWLAQMLSEQSS